MPSANVAIDVPSKLPFWFVTRPDSCRRMRPVVNISEWTPRSLASPSASSAARVEGTAPMPVCTVEPSPMNSAACLAIATSTSVGSDSGSSSGLASLSTRTSISSTWIRCGNWGGRPCVRGKPLAASTISSRSGSLATRMISPIEPPAWRESEQ